jgi:hypothetical protein
MDFAPIEELEALADFYIAHDEKVKNKIRNGMSRELFLDYIILNNFMLDNVIEPEIDEETFMPTDEALFRVAKRCSRHYHRKPARLVEAFKKTCGLDFHDPEKRDEIEEGFKGRPKEFL